MRIPSNDKFIEVISDIVVRFKEHGQYGTKTKAIKAFLKRAPGYSENEYTKYFDFFSELHERTVEILKESIPFIKTIKYKRYKSPEKSLNAWSEGPGKLLYSSMQSKLEPIYPKTSKKVIASFIDWVIFWYYLK